MPPNNMHGELPSATFRSQTAEKYSLINKDHHILMDISHVCVVKLKTLFAYIAKLYTWNESDVILSSLSDFQNPSLLSLFTLHLRSSCYPSPRPRGVDFSK